MVGCYEIYRNRKDDFVWRIRKGSHLVRQLVKDLRYKKPRFGGSNLVAYNSIFFMIVRAIFILTLVFIDRPNLQVLILWYALFAHLFFRFKHRVFSDLQICYFDRFNDVCILTIYCIVVMF